MKFNMNKITFGCLSLVAGLFAAPVLQGCSDDDETMKWVDLRYRVEDSYLLEAKNPETVSFLVSSTDPWEVFGTSDWHTITPASGEPGKKYTVEITCQENKDLDARLDTISIKSDYWIGKKFTITQKGAAYLNVEGVDNIEQMGGEETFNVLSNHSWTAKVTEGDIWLSILSGEKGGKDYTETSLPIVVKAGPNMGELRTGIITIYDHHGKVAQTVECVQKGVVLSPQIPENGKWFKLESPMAQTLEIPVESNAEWTVSKDNAAESTWFDFEETEFNGNATIKINISASQIASANAREGVILLTSKAAEGANPVVKEVRFKQANLPVVESLISEPKEVTSTLQTEQSAKLGRYDVYVESMTGDMFFTYVWPTEKGPAYNYDMAEVRFWVTGGMTELSCYPYCNDVNKWQGALKKPVDISKPHKFSLVISKDPTKQWIYCEWYLDDQFMIKATSDGIVDRDGTSDTFKVPFSAVVGGGYVSIKPNGGKVVKVNKIEYLAPINWGE